MIAKQLQNQVYDYLEELSTDLMSGDHDDKNLIASLEDLQKNKPDVYGEVIKYKVFQLILDHLPHSKMGFNPDLAH